MGLPASSQCVTPASMASAPSGVACHTVSVIQAGVGDCVRIEHAKKEMNIVAVLLAIMARTVSTMFVKTTVTRAGVCWRMGSPSASAPLATVGRNANIMTVSTFATEDHVSPPRMGQPARVRKGTKGGGAWSLSPPDLAAPPLASTAAHV